MTDFDLGWSAGIIDGEGCIRLSRGGDRNCLTPHIEVSACDHSMIVRLQALWGGRSYARRHKNNKKSWRPFWQWYVKSQQALKVLRAVLPHLTAKKEQAEVVLEFAKYINPPGKHLLQEQKDRRAELDSCLRELKRRVA